ncbi:MAG: tRNA pseudouridine(55) synthase TruB [Clostridia bacterium]|nr:tRNA pseudouridine(55) synthase TruB [Clostridia bacterium]
MQQIQNESSGVLLIDKHAGATSHDIVNKVRRAYGTRRVGHTGTLDPMATGLLVVLVGRAAKAAEYLVADTKHYLATLRLGITTDTEDTTGEVITTHESLPQKEQVEAICEAFRGKIQQVPPMYSAIKIGGKKLVDIARAGGEIERAPREIEIFSLTVTPTDTPTDYTLDVVCSSGTYIRTLCADIGKSLGCGGAMASLRRLGAGGFDIENAVTVAQLEQMTPEGREAKLLPIESLFETLPAMRLPAFFERLCRSGCEIYQKKLRTDLAIGTTVRLCDERGHFFALGRVLDYPDGSAVKSIKMFEI